MACAVIAALALGCGASDDDTPPPGPTPWPSPTYRPTLTERPTLTPRPTNPPPPTATETPTARPTPTPAASLTPSETPGPSPTPTTSPTATPPAPTPSATQFPTTPTPSVDGDGDGYPAAQDCDDGAIAIHPGATETCNTLDDDCDNATDEGVEGTFYLDGDGDDYGQGAATIQACAAPEGYSAASGDCDDDNPGAHPDAVEVCDSIDNDCDVPIDEGLTGVLYEDADHDGYGNDEVTRNGCDGATGYTALPGDCDDDDGDVWPGAAEVCDGDDQDCDLAVDEGALQTWYDDVDGDGWGNGATGRATCAPDADEVSQAEDCDDRSAFVYPGATEHCDRRDNDCDGAVDEAGPFYYEDKDRDGYGGPYEPQYTCEGPTGFVPDHSDCDDAAATTHPGATDVCGDGVDNNCDGTIDEAPDADGDGYPVCGIGEVDCDDTDGAVHPGAQEVWGSDVDEDCDGHVDADIYVVHAKEDRPETDKPWDTNVQAALNRATSGQLIAVDDGVFYGTIDFGGKAVKLIGMHGAADTILDAIGLGSAALFISGETRASTLERLTLTGGIGEPGTACGPEAVSQWGGGICIRDASPTIRDVIVTGNQAGRGAGIAVTGGDALLDGNVVSDNIAEEEGGGIYLYETEATLVANVIHLNSSGSRGGGLFVFGSPAVMRNNVVSYNDTEEWGGGVAIQSSDLRFINNTVVANTSTVGSGVHVIEESAPTILGNILAFNKQPTPATGGDNLYIFTNRNNAAVVLYNGLYDPTHANGGIVGLTLDATNKVANPLFVDDPADSKRTDDDYHLKTGSPCIDASSPDTAYKDPDGSRGDQGAYGGPDAMD